jgi:1-acyl-sn-glycerol-3-phosphate acyltransferase
MLSRAVGVVRALAFYFGYALITIVWATLSISFAWAMPFRARFHFVINAWTRIILAWLRVCCGIRHAIEGLDNLPAKPCIVFVKHESTWETLFVQSLFAPQATLIKRELLFIPFFGWAFWLLKPIAIDRTDARRALRALIEEGRARLEQGIWVVLFPEGTRVPVGETRAFQVGGAALAAHCEAPVIVVAHDAGNLWPAHRLRKQAGVVHVKISPPIATTGMRAKEINEAARVWMENAMRELGREPQTSRLTTDSALASMNSRLGST